MCRDKRLFISGLKLNSEFMKAGIQEGDEIIAIDMTRVQSLAQAHALVHRKLLDTEISFTVERRGKRTDLRVLHNKK